MGGNFRQRPDNAQFCRAENDTAHRESASRCQLQKVQNSTLENNFKTQIYIILNSIRFKLMKWWAQSFLVGVPSVICGYRDDDGVVNEMEEFDVEKIRKMGEVFLFLHFILKLNFESILKILRNTGCPG